MASSNVARWVIAFRPSHGFEDCAASQRARMIVGNVVEGGDGGTHDPNVQSTWPIQSNAILVESAENVEIRGNTVTGAFFAFSVGANVGLVQGTDNTADGVAFGFVNSSLVGTIIFRFNDFTNYHVSLQLGQIAGRDFTCNWWGVDTGPVNPSVPDPSVSVFTPWAIAPVANSPHSECSGW